MCFQSGDYSCIAPSLALKWEAEVKEYPEKKRKNWKSSLINSVGMKTLVRYVPKHDKEAYQSNFVEKVNVKLESHQTHYVRLLPWPGAMDCERFTHIMAFYVNTSLRQISWLVYR